MFVADLFKPWETDPPRRAGRSWPRRSVTPHPGATVLERFLGDGRIEIDSHIVERALFAGSHGGGPDVAAIATLLQTAKMNDVDPFAWLSQTLECIANRWPISQIENLMSWNYKA